MTTNPLFNPYSLAQQYRPGPSSSLALALLPTDNFAQKRADAAAAVQYQAMLSGIADQQVAEKEKALAETQATLDTIDKQGLLQTDTTRLNNLYTTKWRQRLQDEIANNYGGDIVKFKRERQPYLVKTFLSELQNAPEFQGALQNKTNYALRQDAIAKGKLIIGNPDQEWADFATGKTATLPFKGAYDAPKEGFDYFDKNTHPFYPYGMKGKPVEVSRDDLAKHLLSQGMTPAQALDYVGKINYSGGSYWKMDSQKPWDAQKTAFDQKVDLRRLGQTDAAQAETRRHNRAEEERNARKDAKENGTGPGSNLSTADLLYNPAAGGAVQQARYGRSVLVTQGLSGAVREQAIRAAGIDPIRNWLSPNPEESNKVGHKSTVHEVYSLDGKVRRRSEKPIVFKDVDGSEVIHDPVTNQPFVKATAVLTTGGVTKEEDVLVPLPKTVAGYMSANDEAGVNDSKFEVSQNAGSLGRAGAQQQQRTQGASAAKSIIGSLFN